MPRGKPEVLVAALFALVLASYVWYTSGVVRDLRASAELSVKVLTDVAKGIADTAEDAGFRTLLTLNQRLREQHIPMIVVSTEGAIYAKANLPFDPGDTLPNDHPLVREYIPTLEKANPAFTDPIMGKVYFGDTPLIQGLRIIPVLQALTGAILLFAFIYIVRTRHGAARERLWAGMARESAHQLGTPLSSLSGWLELLEERGQSDPMLTSVIGHMRGDLVRLDRVAHRFERIGREPKFEPVDTAAMVQRLGAYFRSRVPTLANTVTVGVDTAEKLPPIQGDPILIEWALEVLTRNAIDALAGRGGTVTLSAAATSGDGVSIRVADDGPGVPAEIRGRIFEPGFSTKQSGWGVGLSLAKRIVEENHRGTLALVPSDRGATFEIILH
jgi:signal transduction histidine kinase